MNEIILKVSDLYKIAKELKDNNEELVIVSFNEGDELEDGETYDFEDLFPPSLTFKAISPNEPDWEINYEEISSAEYPEE